MWSNRFQLNTPWSVSNTPTFKNTLDEVLRVDFTGNFRNNRAKKHAQITQIEQHCCWAPYSEERLHEEPGHPASPFKIKALFTESTCYFSLTSFFCLGPFTQKWTKVKPHVLTAAQMVLSSYWVRWPADVLVQMVQVQNHGSIKSKQVNVINVSYVEREAPTPTPNIQRNKHDNLLF